MNVRSEQITGGSVSTPLSSPLIAELKNIWQEALEVPEIGDEDDFFDLGGHSLLSIEIRARVKKMLGVSFIRVDVLSTPTVTLMAESILEQLNSATQASDPGAH